jgi:N-methylhydantoinase B
LPINEGLYRPVSIDLGPQGTMLNAARPAACSLSTGNPWENVFEAVTDAFSKIVPQRSCAGWAHVACSSVSGIDPRYGEPYGGLMHVTYHGGSGAVYSTDGGHLWGSIVAAGAPQVGDVELLELRLPLEFHRYELVTDSPCPGTWRGGCGAELELEIVDHEAVITHFGDGTRFPPPSRLDGGSTLDADRRVHRKSIVRADGAVEPLPMHSVVTAGHGERLIVRTPGGGGVGSPVARPPERVAEDVRHGFVSLSLAGIEYGVVLDPETLAVDQEATARLRAQVTSQ